MSGVITVVTVPLVAYYFNQLPWLGLFTNLIAVPVMGILLVPIGLASGIWQIVVGGTVLPMASLNQSIIEYYIAAVRLVSMFPGGEWHVAAPSVFNILLFYIFIVFLPCCYLELSRVAVAASGQRSVPFSNGGWSTIGITVVGLVPTNVS
jgi:competence protein ComEC